MTGGKHAAASTFDRMMAEIKMEDEDDENVAGSAARHAVAVRKADAKSDGGEWGQKDRSSTNPAKSISHEAKARDDLSVSLPSAPRKARSRRGSRSHDEIKGGDDSADDDSDDEKEARVRHQDAKAFSDQVQKETAQREPTIDLRQDTGALRIFVTQAPKHGSPALRCFVQRDRQGLNRFSPVYRLFLEDGKQFLLTAQKRTSNKTSNYLLSLSKTPVDRRSPLVIAKLRANWSGSSYTIFDDGLSPAKTAIDASVRNILGFVEFAYDDMGPGRLNARIPKVLESGRTSTKWSDRDHDQDHAARRAFEAALDTSALLLRNKRPQFDAKSGGHVLDFQGRVTMPSVKNFQMQSDAHADDTVLQFGRVSCQPPGPHRQCKCHKDTFTMDLRHPLSPVQAFAICLAALDAKVADAKAYERVSSLFRKLSS